MSVNTELRARAVGQQAAVVNLLNTLPGVDAGPLDVVSHEQCEVDPSHGTGTCVFGVKGALCPACALQELESRPASQHLAVDVLL